MRRNKRKNLSDLNLTVFWDLGTSLSLFNSIGSLDREIAVYREVAKETNSVTFITYGGKNDYKFSSHISPIKLISLHWHSLLKKSMCTLPELLLRYREQLENTDIFKTNQIPGAEVILNISKRYNKKLIVRCGYLHSQFLIKKGYPQKVIERTEELEIKAFKQANAGVVTSQWQKEYLVNNLGISESNLSVIPNYVQTDNFKPMDIKKKYDLIFIGRGSGQKNLKSLFKALVLLRQQNRPATLLMVGSCKDYADVSRSIDELQLNDLVTLYGNATHTQLPKLLNSARVYILPSLFEGHPKSMLEAMSCGLPCIGTDVEGIREDITHLENGFLCKIDEVSLASAINLVLKNVSLQSKIGKNARRYITSRYDLRIIASKELDLLEHILL